MSTSWRLSLSTGNAAETQKRKTPGHKLKENEFLEKPDYLFGIAYSDALVMIKIHEDREFLISQR